MTDSPAVRREDQPSGRGRYVIETEGAESEMTYRLSGGVMAIDHTFTPPEARGKGTAAMLVKAAVADARAQGFRIRPICSYVVAQFARHPEWADLKA